MGMGHRKWCIPDLYMKEPGNMPTPSHESITLLNVGERQAEAEIILIFEDRRDNVILDHIQIDPMSAVHVRMDQLKKWGVAIPTSVCYSALINSTEAIVVEYARFNWIDGAAQSFAVIPYYED